MLQPSFPADPTPSLGPGPGGCSRYVPGSGSNSGGLTGCEGSGATAAECRCLKAVMQTLSRSASSFTSLPGAEFAETTATQLTVAPGPSAFVASRWAWAQCSGVPTTVVPVTAAMLPAV